MWRRHWQDYKNFFGIHILRYLIGWFAAVPLSIHLFANFPRVIKFTIFEHMINIPISPPFRWWVLWFASFAYVLAYLLYAIFCPPFIRSYNSFSDYKSVGHSSRWIVWEILFAVNDARSWRNVFKLQKQPDGMLRILMNKQLAFLSAEPTTTTPKKERDATTVYIEYGSTTIEIKSGPGLPDKEMVEEELFWELFEYMTESGRIVRFVIFVLIVLSAALVAWTVLENIEVVLIYAWGSVFH